MIQVENLTKYYGDYPAITDVSFHVDRGEIVGFLGPNGAGKTTTMRILTGYMPPTSGTATVGGYDVFADSLEMRRHIGYLPETVPLYTDMSVRSYLDFMARIRGVSKPRPRIEEVMALVNVEDEADTLIGHLSKGYRQRVGLAQALVHDPEVLILDEPTIGLDPRQIREVRDLIKDLAGNHTIILSTHILPEASQTCNRIVIINEGTIVAEDTPQRLTERLAGAERILVRVQIPSNELVDSLAAVTGVQDVQIAEPGAYELTCSIGTDCRAEIASTIVNQGSGLLEMRPLILGLEDIFLQLTQTDQEAAAEEREEVVAHA